MKKYLWSWPLIAGLWIVFFAWLREPAVFQHPRMMYWAIVIATAAMLAIISMILRKEQ